MRRCRANVWYKAYTTLPPNDRNETLQDWPILCQSLSSREVQCWRKNTGIIEEGKEPTIQYVVLYIYFMPYTIFYIYFIHVSIFYI